MGQKIGIYCIKNKIDDKRYIGKSINIINRFRAHKWETRREVRKKDTNRHLYSAIRKYGIENFVFEILEEFDFIDEDKLKERELHWMDYYQTCDRNFGYNLRRDSSTKMIVHEETKVLLSKANSGENNPNYGNYWSEDQKQKMSKIAKERHTSGEFYTEEWKQKISKHSSEMWLDEGKKKEMAEKVSQSKSTFRFYQYDKKTKELIKIWESIGDIKKFHPDYHLIAIYSVCNGHKKSYRGYVWKKELKE